ncbi:hypothetical protein [Nostoc sp. GT001]|uniref:hypothetical protein n=1 Tax=Nostoc sp. GT001 TaxID=3056647 RepID=UPI0025AB4705|nr:hypothetical protein [Nostoc sp. GT001]MDM9583100.1 hypothetical protein [Nostoc sp. GT001]
MASSLVDLIVRVAGAAAATSAFGRIGAAMGGLGRSANTASGGTQSLTSAIAGGIIQANLLGQALSLVGNAASLMGQKFEEAKTIEMGDVSAASTFAALTGKSFQESSKFVSDFSKEISLVAGALPGATKDYNKVANSIMDNVIPAFKDANGVLDQGKFQENLVDITKKMTLMGISSGTDAQAVGMFTARLLDGNVASAKQLLFADNNPAFMGKFKEALEKQGKTEKDFKTMTSKQRLELVQAVSEQFISKDVIDAASNTVDGLLAGIESSIFDPKSGVFGLLRDLTKDEGNQTVMTAVASSIKAMMSFFDAGASILQALGVPSVDPMLVLYNGINIFTEWVKKASSFATNLANLAKGAGGGITGASAIITKIFNPDFILGSFQKLINSIQSFIKPDILVSSFRGMMGGAQKFFKPDAILNGLEKLLSGVNTWIGQFFSWLVASSGKILSSGGGAIGFGVIGVKLGIFGGQLIGKLIQFIINLPWGDILIFIGNLALAAIPFAIGLIAGFRASIISEIGKGLLSIGAKLLEGLNNVVLVVSYSISEFFSYLVSASETAFNLGENLGNLIGEKLLEGLNNVVLVVSYSISEFFSYLVSASETAFNLGENIGNLAATSIQEFHSAIGSAITSTQSFFATIGNAIADMWNQLLSAITGAIGSVINQTKSTISAPVAALNNFVTNPIGTASSAVAGVGQAVSNPIGTASSAVIGAGQTAFNLGQNIASGATNLLGFYKGHIPTASGGLLGAFATESRNMPSGASPVVANSSEFILTPAQMGRLMQGSAAVGSSAKSTVFSPVINVYGVNDPVAIARLALEQLEIMYAQQQEGQLA